MEKICRNCCWWIEQKNVDYYPEQPRTGFCTWKIPNNIVLPFWRNEFRESKYPVYSETNNCECFEIGEQIKNNMV